MKEKVLYFECKTGAAGDMLMGALYALMAEEEKERFLSALNSIDQEIQVAAEKKTVKGICGLHMKVQVCGQEEGEQERHCDDHSPGHSHSHGGNHSDSESPGHSHGESHSHTSYLQILDKISHLELSENVRNHSAEIYRTIGEAESKVHGTVIEQIHFHEVGSLDALVDVVGCCLAIEMLQIDRIEASPVCVGNGTVRCAHGILPVPAPATAEIIKGIPVYTSKFDGELLTPTGAAVLKHFVQSYTKEMEMEAEAVGYGMGTKEFKQVSFVRTFLGYRERK